MTRSLRFPTLRDSVMATDDELIRMLHDAREGDRAALETLIAAIMPSVATYLARVFGPDNTDLLQVTLLNVARKIGQSTATSPGQFLAWCNTIAHHTAVDELRAEVAHPQPLGDGSDEVPAGHTTPSTAAVRNERDLCIQHAVDQLPTDQAQVMRLKYFESRSLAYIAGVMQRSLAAVKMLLFRGREALREALEEE